MTDRQRLEVTLVLRRNPIPQEDPLLGKARHRRRQLPKTRARLSRQEVARLRRVRKADLAQIEAFAKDHGLTVRSVHEIRREVVLSGSVKAINAAFGVKLLQCQLASGKCRSHKEPIHLPAELHGIVDAVLGLDETPAARSWFLANFLAKRLYSLPEIARHYDFPKKGTGRGQRIAILSFGGGFHVEDLQAFFAKTLDHGGPRVRSVSVLSGENNPLAVATLRDFVKTFSKPGATFQDLSSFEEAERGIHTVETTMDVEIAGVLAPEAAIDVICAPNTAKGFRAAILAALGHHEVVVDGVEQDRIRRANVISISWGDAELKWTPHDMKAIHGAIEEAELLGVTVCCASGDFGSRCTGPGEQATLEPPRKPPVASVSFPASSPSALACGGTTLRSAPDGTITDETAWNCRTLGLHVASGGGVSGFFPRPSYQEHLSLPKPGKTDSGIWVSPTLTNPTRFVGRGVPDVAANADMDTGYRIFVGGVDTAGSGTSASAPVWAALLAVVGERLGVSAGWVNALLYADSFSTAFRDVVRGSNDVEPGVRFFRARSGWDACDGLGSPLGTRLLAALGGSPNGS